MIPPSIHHHVFYLQRRSTTSNSYHARIPHPGSCHTTLLFTGQSNQPSRYRQEILGGRRLRVSNLIIVITSPDTRSSGISISSCGSWSTLVIATSRISGPAATSTSATVTSTSTRSRSSAVWSRSRSCLRATPGPAVSVSGGWGRDWAGSGSRQGAGGGRGNRAPGRGCRELFAAVGGWNEIWRAGVVGGTRSAGRVRRVVVRGVCGGRVGVHEGIEVRATRSFGASVPSATIGV